MSICLILLMSYGMWNSKIHEILGVLFILIILFHHALNKRRYKIPIIKIIFFSLLCFSLFGSLITGILLSNFLFENIRIIGISYSLQILHLFFAYVGFIFLAIHVGKYLRMIYIVIFHRKRIWKYLFYGLGMYGVFACFKEKIFDYIFLRQHFVLYDENVFLFIFNYVSIFLLFSILGYHMARK